MHDDDTRTVMLLAPSEISSIGLTTFTLDWSEDTDHEVDIPTEPGTTYFINADGLAFDYVENSSIEAIQNYCTRCHSVIVVAEHETPTEDDFRAYNAAVLIRALNEDCFGN